jgi:hypothetical protein
MSPQRKAGTIFCETVLCFHRIAGLVFKKDSRIFWFSKDFRIRFSRTLELDGFTQEYGLVFRTLDWFFQNGQRIILDYLFACIKIDILYTFFNILLISFSLLRSKLICI